MAERVVRVTRSWDVVVSAEYGDTDEALLQRALAGTLDGHRETVTLLPAEIGAADVALEDAPASGEPV